MRDVFDDLRYVWRQLRRTPGFTFVAVLTLALGIGTNTTFFAVIDAVVWRPLRGAGAEDVYQVYLYRPPQPSAPAGNRLRFQESYALAVPQLDQLRSDPSLGVLATTGISLQVVTAQTPVGAKRVTMEIVRGNYAAVYQMRPVIGQLVGLDGNEDGGPTVVISEPFWREYFRRDRAAIDGGHVRLNGRVFTIAGVAQRTAAFPLGTDVWISRASWGFPESPALSDDPKRQQAARAQFEAWKQLARESWAQMRLRPGVDPARLEPMMDAVLAKGSSPPESQFKVEIERVVTDTRIAARATTLVLGLCLLVLLAACANVANMLYARAAHRTGEIAVRLSLGAGTARIFRLFLLEAFAIAGLAAVSGMLLALTVMRWADANVPALPLDRVGRNSIELNLTPDWRFFAFAAATGLLAAMLVGAVTAWRGSRTPPMRLVGGSGIATVTPRGSRLRTALVAVQVSAAVILLLGTGLFLIRALTDTTPVIQFDTDHLATAQIEFDRDRYFETQVPDRLDELLARVERLEGVDGAAIANGAFGGVYSPAPSLKNLIAEDEAQPGRLSSTRLLTGSRAAVSSGFLNTLGLRLTSGRNVAPSDRDGAPEVVLLSDSAARSLWPTMNPLGKRVRLSTDPRWFTVVGTFEDPLASKADTPLVCSACAAIVPWSQWQDQNRGERQERRWLVIVRAASPATAIERVRLAINRVDPDIPVFNPTVADSSIFATTNAQTLFGFLMGSLGLLSMAIAALGIYGVISYSVSRRTREFGIRLALGATPRRILKAVLDDAVHLVLVGLLPGVLLASWSTRVLESSIVRLMPNDIPTWAAVPVVVLAIGLVAAWIPARRAARVDPNVALREL